MKYLILLLLPFSVFADQISLQGSTRVTNSADYYTVKDRRIQYNYDLKDDYIFLQYRQIGVCPTYCGFRYEAKGIGYGINHKVGKFNFFAQAGYYFIDNSVGVTQHNESIEYHLNNRYSFFGGGYQKFKSFEVETEDTYGITLGFDIPIRDYGFKVSYTHMAIKEVLIGRFNYDPSSLNLWWEPVRRSQDTINAGFYWNF